MKDNIEGGSRETGSARQVPAQSAAPTTSERSSAPHATQDNGTDNASPSVSTDMQQFIGRQLRAVFDDVAKQPIPDRFLELMRQLDSKTG